MDDQRGVSSVMGVVLLLGMTLMVVTVILVSSVVVLGDAQSDARISQMENSMSQLSSKASLVALGDSNTHHFHLGNVDDGSIETRPEAGHLTMVYNRSGDPDVTLLNESLGALVYESDDVEIAYQAGGVWKKENGWSTMISPPEFYYRDATLTFPIIQVDGDFRKSGSVQGQIATDGSEGAIYPNATFFNPLTNGSIIIEIESDYATGWEQFFTERTEGDISVDPDGSVVTVELVTHSDTGDYSLSDGITTGGIKEDPGIEAFNMTFVTEGAQGFNPVLISLHSAENEEGEEFEIFIDPHNSNPQQFLVYFRDGDTEELWIGDTTEFEVETEGNGNSAEHELYVDFLSENVNLSYTTDEQDGNDLYSSVNDLSNQATINNTTYEDGNETTLGTLVEHYLVNMEGSIDLKHQAQGGQGGPVLLDEEASTGNVIYDPEGDIIQYLHVTNRTIEIQD